MYRSIVAFSLCVAILSVAVRAHAQVVEVQYRPVPGVSLNYGVMGYTPDGGDFTPLTDSQIVSARALFDFKPDAGVDATTFIATMVVPVLGAQSEYFEVLGTSFTQPTPGNFHFELPVTNDFNGIVRGGRFSVDCYALDPDTGDPIAISGTLSDASGFYFSVAIPEPASAAGLALLLLCRRR